MIEQLSLTTVQKALTVVNEWLLSFSPSSLSFSFTPSVSSQFAPTSFSLYLSPTLSHSLFEHEEEGRNPLLSSRETFTIGLVVSIEMLVPVFATLSPSSPPSSFFFALQSTREKTRENRCNRGRQDPWTMSRLSSVPLQLKSPFILCTVSDCVCRAYKRVDDANVKINGGLRLNKVGKKFSFFSLIDYFLLL